MSLLKSLPACIYQTRSGTLYHLSPVNQAFFDISYLGLSISDFFHLKSMLDEIPFNFNTFLGFGSDKNLVLEPIDCLKQCIRGSKNKHAVDLNTKSGFRHFTIEDYIRFAKKMEPKILVSLTEFPDSENGGNKSHNRCLQKSLSFLDKIITDIYQAKHTPSHLPLLFASLQGGRSVSLRQQAIVDILKRKEINGVMIYGLWEGEELETRKEILNLISKEIQATRNNENINLMNEEIDKNNNLSQKQNKNVSIIEGQSDFTNEENKEEQSQKIETQTQQKRSIIIAIHCFGEPVEIIEGAGIGGELFDVEFPFFLAENESAFIYKGLEFPRDVAILQKYEGNYEELLKNRRSIIQDLYLAPFETDQSPIDSSCSCYTCKGFTKGYIYHLLKYKEMTGNVLLVLHNMHCFELFFKNLKDAQQLNMEKKFFEWFLKENTVEGNPREYKKKAKRVNPFERLEDGE